MKFILFALFISIFSFSNTNLELKKQKLKYDLISVRERPPKLLLITISDRLEADAILELATEGYRYYKNYKESEILELTPRDEIILIMPRIDLLEKHLEDLSKKSNNIYVFIMENDKLDGSEYGDRSYETYIKKGLDKKIPNNVTVFRLKDDSVIPYGNKNLFNFSDIKESSVFKNQILKMYNSVSKIRVFDKIK